MSNIDRTFKLKFNSSSNTMKMKFKNTSNTSDMKFEPSSKDKDIYYDEIIDYDGGGVDGYGYD